MFESLKRQEFRDYFQPSRVVIAFVRSEKYSYNPITLCFSMYCSYKPNIISFAVQKTNFTYGLIKKAEDCVLAIPGERIVEETLFCGEKSGRKIDKILECGFSMISSSYVDTPSLEQAKANVELKIIKTVDIGDHVTVFGEVKNFSVNKNNKQRNILSVGSDNYGYKVLLRRGIHRLAVID